MVSGTASPAANLDEFDKYTEYWSSVLSTKEEVCSVKDTVYENMNWAKLP